ncbi:DUF6265 family protein [Flavobacterium sp.]|uniref:DUF6265 family protein n=1 Tax=Flavobacterium sp. TaxID=239 RepID=UPI0025BCB199|nr:DUF6265 family protein [Flavobacterium sp.]MBA4155099.1 hypothetical protein [Flavobacterium sp.]
MKNKIYVLFLLAICSFSCEQKSKTYAELEKANWFIGKWENKTTEGTFSEEWKKENDSLLLGKSFFIKENDTLFSETVRLEQRKNDLFYIVTVPNQNEEKPVEFKLTSSSADYLVFENPAHDFPKKITYKLVTKDSLYAEISGDGKKQGFPFKKVN